MNAPTRMLFLVIVLLCCTLLACRGALIVNWLNEPIWLNADPPPVIGQPDLYDIDMDGNGTIDFSFSGIWHVLVDFRSESSNRYLIRPSPPPNTGGPVAALELGFYIGADSGNDSLDWFGDNYDYWSGLMLNLYPGEAGEFWGRRAYIGVEFQSDDGIHYGWFDVEGGTSGPDAVIRGWGYESTPGMGLIAGAIPEPSTLILFGAGATAIFLSRCKRKIR